MIHPIIPVWITIIKSAGLRQADVCTAAGIAQSSFSRYRHGYVWPSLATARRINAAIGQLIGRSGEDVDNLVERLWISGGKVGEFLFKGDSVAISPQVIPYVIRRRGDWKNRGRSG